MVEKGFIITEMNGFQKSHADDKRCHAYNEGQACKRQRKEKKIMPREVLILDGTLLVSLKKPQTQKLLTITVKETKRQQKSTK